MAFEPETKQPEDTPYNKGDYLGVDPIYMNHAVDTDKPLSGGDHLSTVDVVGRVYERSAASVANGDPNDETSTEPKVIEEQEVTTDDHSTDAEKDTSADEPSGSDTPDEKVDTSTPATKKAATAPAKASTPAPPKQ